MVSINQAALVSVPARPATRDHNGQSFSPHQSPDFHFVILALCLSNVGSPSGKRLPCSCSQCPYAQLFRRWYSLQKLLPLLLIF